MKITKITYQKSYVIGPYLQERIGFEADISEDKQGHIDIENALRILQLEADTYHDRYCKYKEPVQEQPASPSSPMPIIDRSAKEKLEIAIDNADSIETLSTLKEEASKHGLVSQYMNKLKELTEK